jgi:hypothetical protein
MGFDAALDQQIFFYIYLACLSACITTLFICIFPKLNRGILSALLLNLALLFSFANVLIQEWSHYPEGYLVWGLGIMSAAYAVKCFSRSGGKKDVLISFLLLFVSVNFYQVNIQLFLIFGALVLMLDSQFRFTRELFIRVAKLLAIAALAAASNILILKGLQAASIAAPERRAVTTGQFTENLKTIIKLVANELSDTPYSIIGTMVWACVILFTVYVIVAVAGGRKTLPGGRSVVAGGRQSFPGVALMLLLGALGFLSTFGLHLVSSTVWAVPRTLVGIAFIISALSIAIAFNVKSKKGRAALLIALSVAFLVNVYHVQAMSVNQYANNRLDQEYALNVAHAIDEHEAKTGETISKIALCPDSNMAYAYHGNIRYIIGDMNQRAARVEWADTQLINYYSHRNLQEVIMDEDVYNRYFKDKDWDVFIPDEQMVFIGDTLYIAVY